MSLVSVVCPLHRSVNMLPGFLEHISTVLLANYDLYEIILVDDGSGDGTGSLVSSLCRRFSRVRYLELSCHSGREFAIAAGLDTSVGDYVIVLNPGVDPPDLIPHFVELCQKGAPLVLGVDTVSKRGIFYSLGSSLFHFYSRSLGLDLVPGSTGFCCLSRQAVDSLTRFGGKRRFLRLFMARVGFSRELVTYQPLISRASPGLFQSFRNAVDVIVGASSHPLRWLSGLGLFSAGLSFFYVLYVVAIYFLKEDGVAEGWTTLSLQMAGMFFLLFLLLAVLCEYVSRVLEEVQQRPLYFVSRELMSDHSLEEAMRANVVGDSLETPVKSLPSVFGKG